MLDLSALQNEIVEDLTIELSAEETFSAELLTSKVKGAIREVYTARKYPSTYTEDMITSDMNRFYSQIKGIALYDYNLIGAEGEESHNENGINRHFVNRKSLFNGVTQLAKL